MKYLSLTMSNSRDVYLVKSEVAGFSQTGEQVENGNSYIWLKGINDEFVVDQTVEEILKQMAD